jgi:hypothetical protein
LVNAEFKVEDLANRVSKIESIEDVQVGPDAVYVQFQDADGYTYRASMVLAASSDWRLTAMEFQCPICFGDGVNDGETCTMCGGKGWGVS